MRDRVRPLAAAPRSASGAPPSGAVDRPRRPSLPAPPRPLPAQAAAAPAIRQPPPATPSRPSWSLPRPIHDVGQVARGEKVDAEFVLDNQGEGAARRSAACGRPAAARWPTSTSGSRRARSGSVRASVDTRTSPARSRRRSPCSPTTRRRRGCSSRSRRTSAPYVVAQPAYARFVHTPDAAGAGDGADRVGSPDAVDFARARRRLALPVRPRHAPRGDARRSGSPDLKGTAVADRDRSSPRTLPWDRCATSSS